MEKQTHTFSYSKNFPLEGGEILPGFQLEYTTLGSLNKDKSNVIWICHALTGSADFTTWWGELFTSNGVFSPNEYFIICANTLGGCYGSTGPLTENPATGEPYYHTFPILTNRDAVAAFDLLRNHLDIKKIHTLIGGSLGGQQVLEWAIECPDVFDHIIPIGCNAVHSPWGIAFNEAQRMAIEADQTWESDRPDAGMEGLKAARAIGMISYRAYQTFLKTQSEANDEVTDNFRAASYQRYQGVKLTRRFNAFTYWTLSKMMDSHNIGRSRISREKALKGIRAKTLVIGIDTDLLFPVSEQEYIQAHIPGAKLEIIGSLYGHDGFLVEFAQLQEFISGFYRETVTRVLI